MLSRQVLLAIALLPFAGCAVNAQADQMLEHLYEARDRIGMGHRKLAIEQIDAAIAIREAELDGNGPTPEPEPEPEPPTPEPEPPAGEPVGLPDSSSPWHLLLDKVNGGANYGNLDSSKVDGLSIRVRWSTINPSNGVYDFDLIDRLANEAKQRGKWWTLRIMAGTNAPRWLDCPTYSDGDGTFPLPWCPEYKSQFDKLMLALGMAYKDDQKLVMIHVPGFDESAEMHMPKGRDWPTNDMAEAWEQRIDVTAAAFPRQLICLNHSPEDWSAAVIQWHERLGKSRACFQMNALKASTNTGWSGYTTLEGLDRSGWPVGFQFVGPSTNTTRFGGTFAEGYRKGESAGARWYEFYQPDTGDLP